MIKKEVKIIEAASENGAGKRGASLGPKAVLLEARAQGLPMFRDRSWIVAPNYNDQYSPEYNTPYARNIENIIRSQEALCELVENTLNDDYFPLLLSGDHSNAIGGVSGLRNFYNDERIGVIWVDAHFDLHSPYTTPSGNLHGMALNALIDKDNLECKINQPAQLTEDLWEKLKRLGSHQICPKIQTSDIVFIGVRDFEEPEQELTNRFNIKVFNPDDIREQGISKILEQTLSYLAACDVLYVSFDVDSQDTTISMGTGTPVEGGLMFAEADEVFKTLFHHPKVKLFEITEINPLLDKDNAMAKDVVKLLSGVLSS